ncbi:hypothetical protein [Undibacterium squillarum]|uniref:hypothetical protein n=1 Tax=Undibacterium squillarum TaxID=1131567 RepID=UPI0035B25BE2
MPTIEDVYCKFGFVSEAAQLLETELGTVLFRESASETDLFNNPDPKVAREIYKKISTQTLGRLINNTKSKVKSLDSLSELLSAALTERNRLAHSFFLEHNVRLRAENDRGRVLMIDDLERMHEIIFDAYKAVMLLSGIDLEKISGDDCHSVNSALPEHYKFP